MLMDVNIRTVNLSHQVLNNHEHYRNLKRHILREGKKYIGVKCFVNELTEQEGAWKYRINKGCGLHFVMEVITPIHDVYKEFEQISTIIQLFHASAIMTAYGDDVCLASLVGGQNIGEEGSLYEMAPAYHLIVAPKNKVHERRQEIISTAETFWRNFLM